MTHKQDRVSGYRWRNPRRIKRVVNEYERPDATGRPLLYSNPIERTTAEGRAKLISDLITDDFGSRDFPNPHGPTKDTDPLCLSAAQQNVFHESFKQKPVIPLYPSTVPSLRWCPDVETYPCHEDESEDIVKYTCRCDNCTSSNCPSRTTSSSTVKRGPGRDNIARYCDQSTMTPRLTDASCNARKSITYIPDLSDVPCESPPVRDTQPTCLQEPFLKCAGMKCPAPILKKKHNYDEYCRKFLVPFDKEAVRDIDDVEDHCCEPTAWTTTYRYFSKNRNKQKRKQYCDGSVGTSECESEKNRKVLYNEGICDSVIDRNLLDPAPCGLNRNASRASINNMSRSRCYLDFDGYIPYSHRGHSKYHHDCKKSIEPTYKHGTSTTEELRKLKEGPFWLRNAYCNRKPVIHYNRYIPCCLPRKMITSEKNIESFIRCNRKC